ncbi:MAG: TetR/AcrR family transcriptional regulator [Pseudomonadota bacterium]
MVKAVQARTLLTRAKLFDAAQSLVSKSNYEALRVEDIVLNAGVAKGTFFAHFRDKDALLDQLLGAEMDHILADLSQKPVPTTPEDMALALSPLIDFMARERYVFDIIFRYSGAGSETEIGPIALTFGKQMQVFMSWVNSPNWVFRTDIDAVMIAEGIQAFLLQVVALKFCSLHNSVAPHDRLSGYLSAWLK